jgi:hypothetical protein
VRTGRYVCGDALALLRGNLEATVKTADAVASQSHLVLPFGPMVICRAKRLPSLILT